VMPVMDGLEATRRLRAMPLTRGVPIVIVSAGATADDRQNALEVGANAFLPKPLDLHRLLAEIGSLLQLTWLPDTSDLPSGGTAGAAPRPVGPPAEELEILYQLAKAGNMRRIRERALHLASLSDDYRDFSNNLLLLAGRFESRAILDLVRQYLQWASQR
jgi:CheY-like chemotaxis protein